MNRTFAVVVAFALVGLTVFAPTAAAQSPAEQVQPTDSPSQASLGVTDPVIQDHQRIRHGGGSSDDGGDEDPDICGNGGCPDPDV